MDVVATNNWVKENFKLQYLAAAQKAFFSYYNKIPIKVDEIPIKSGMKWVLLMWKVNKELYIIKIMLSICSNIFHP